MKILITGGAGFIGSNLAEKLLKRGDDVIIYDNFSTGQRRNLELVPNSHRLKIIEGDLLNIESLKSAISSEIEFVFHLAANADIRFGLDRPERDLQQNTIATFNVLEAMRASEVRRIAFSSTGSVYGEPDIHPTPENAPFPIQTSLYAASKVAGESLIQAYAEGYGFQGFIFRFVSILGRRYSHGHVFDFCKQLKKDPNNLRVLGNGKQRKSYLSVDDCVDAMLTVIERAPGNINVYNLGTDDSCVLTDSICWICKELGVKPKLQFTGGERGWVGDSPYIHLNVDKVQSLGWSPELSIEEAVKETVKWISDNEWILEART
jgi:UDP-glucose 4-epimerase